MAEEVLPYVRGRVDWTRYAIQEVPRGAWQHYPCRFPQLGHDPVIRAEVRFALERLHRTLVTMPGRDLIALRLAEEARQLLITLTDVRPVRPRRQMPRTLSDPIFQAGVQALGWIVDDRGLGGQAELHGLSWTAAMDALWERFVEGTARAWAGTVGGSVATDRQRNSWVPIRWTPRGTLSMGHLAPDVVIRIGDRIVILDAKYKAHLAGMDAQGWRGFSADERVSHRADLHQALAYASLFDAASVTTALVYPLRQETWDDLVVSDRTVTVGELGDGGRRVRVALVGLPFGWNSSSVNVQVKDAWRSLLTG